MMKPEISGASELVYTLREQLQPLQDLNLVWWSKLLKEKEKDGWLYHARQMYYTLKATAPMLQLAAAEAQKRGEDLGDFVEWARRHAEEEKEHYRWYRDDLRAMGIDPDEVETGIPDSHLLRLLGAQFTLVTISHPVALLGYFYVMECHPPETEKVRALARQFSIPDAGLRTLLFHASADQEHRLEIVKLVEKYAQPSSCSEPILASAIETLMGWTMLFQDFTESLDETP